MKGEIIAATSEIDKMNESKQIFKTKRLPPLLSGQTHANKKGEVVIEFSGWSNASHEFSHAGQFLKGEASFAKGKKARKEDAINNQFGLYDIYDEVNAYRRQYAFQGGAKMPGVNSYKDISPALVRNINMNWYGRLPSTERNINNARREVRDHLIITD